jgi:hypothetical protein
MSVRASTTPTLKADRLRKPHRAGGASLDASKSERLAGRDTARAMSRENVELLGQATDAMNRRNLDGFLALMDAEVEAVSRLVAIEGGYHGHDGIRRWWENLLDVFPDFKIEVVEVREIGDRTFAVLRNRAHGGGSDIPLEQTLWHVAEWRDRKVIWWSAHLTEAEALEAAGLSE